MLPTRRLLWFALLLGAVGGCAAPGASRVAEAPVASLAVEEAYGIRIERLELSAAGHMVDFRFKVLDTEKAQPLFLREIKPYLIDLASGARLVVPNPPKTGPLRTSDPPQEGRIYFMLFGNTRKIVDVGSRVTIVIGEFRAEDLVVH